MPKNNIDYSKTVMYKIVCKDLSITDLYVGSTTSFTKRKTAHKYSSSHPNKSNYHYKIYETIRNNGGWNNWEMLEIEKFPCNDGNESRTRERYWVEELQPKMNTKSPLVTQEELKEYHCNYAKSEKFKINCKIYRDNNKAKINEYFKKRRETHKDEIKERKKIYYEENKEAISEKRRKRYKENKKD
jgi:hypothetical protein